MKIININLVWLIAPFWKGTKHIIPLSLEKSTQLLDILRWDASFLTAAAAVVGMNEDVCLVVWPGCSDPREIVDA